MTALIDRRGARQDGMSHEDTIVKIVQYQAALAAHNYGSLTDNTGAVADGTVQGVLTPFVATANSGTNLATLADAQTAFHAVQNEIASVLAQADGLLTALGAVKLSHFVDNSGGTVSTTMGAAPAGVTAAATGPSATAANTVLGLLNGHLYVATNVVRQACVATGTPEGFLVNAGFRAAEDASINVLTQHLGVWAETIPVYDPTALGAAGSPGVTKVAFDAAVARYFKDIKALVSALNACTAVPAPKVVVYGNRRSTPLKP